MRVLCQETLAPLGCGNPECPEHHDVLVLSPDCHPGEPAYIIYSKARGMLQLQCAVCRAVTAEVAVAETPPEVLDEERVTVGPKGLQ